MSGLLLAFALRRPRIFLFVVAAELLAEVVADVLKVVVDRPRPHVARLVALPHSASFPSGHSTTSFACATVLGALLPRVRVPALLLAAAIAYSRLYVGVHYPGDVLAGSLLGVACGVTVLRVARARRVGR